MGLFDRLSREEYYHWQSIVAPNVKNGYLLSNEQLKSASRIYFESHNPTIEDSVRLVNETCNPDIYFKRLNTVINELSNFVFIEKYYEGFFASSPSKFLESVMSIREQSIHDFIKRSWEKSLLNLSKLKTEKSRINKANELFCSLEKYKNEISNTNNSYIKELKASLSIKELPKQNIDEIKEASLINQLNSSKNAVDRHFTLIALQEFYYNYRSLDEKYIDECIKYCLLDINQIDALQKDWIQQQIDMIMVGAEYREPEETKKEIDSVTKAGFEFNIPAFKRLAIIYENRHEYDKALDICNRVLKYKRYEEFLKRRDKIKNKLSSMKK